MLHSPYIMYPRRCTIDLQDANQELMVGMLEQGPQSHASAAGVTFGASDSGNCF